MATPKGKNKRFSCFYSCFSLVIFVLYQRPKGRSVYKLLKQQPRDAPRNPNEQLWRDKGLTTYTSERFEKVYKNQSKLRCGLRIKYEELRIIWGRQELNRYKSKYNNFRGDNNTSCSYCNQSIEDEKHLYIECLTTNDFWEDAKEWFCGTFGAAPILRLNGPRLFGLENEPPDDLHNIFYRCARYAIFTSRKRAPEPSIRYFVSLVKDEFKLKYAGNKIVRHADKPSEKKAVAWMREQLGWGLHTRRTKPKN